MAHRQLLKLGLSASAVQKRTASGRLHTVHRGVYAVGYPRLTWKGRLMAAVLACGPGALVGRRSAAALQELLSDSRSIVDVVGPRSRGPRPGIAVHRARMLHPDDRVEIDGIPVTSLARTLLDIAAVVPQQRLLYAVEQADRQDRLDMRALDALLARSQGRRGVRALRAALTDLHPEAKHARSPSERRFLAFCRRHGLPDPALNAVVEGFTVDALWPAQRLIVELDGWDFHRSRSAFERDRRRDAVLAVAGYRVVRITSKWLKHAPEQVAETLLGLLSGRPSPAATA